MNIVIDKTAVYGESLLLGQILAIMVWTGLRQCLQYFWYGNSLRVIYYCSCITSSLVSILWLVSRQNNKQLNSMCMLFYKGDVVDCILSLQA